MVASLLKVQPFKYRKCRSSTPEVFLRNRASMKQIYKRTPMPKRDFNKVAKGPKLGKLTKKIGRPKVEPNGTKLGLKLGFSPFS